jgi:hypothetical protein
MCEAPGSANPDILKKFSQIVCKLFTKQRP